jgi:hypothetical protein
MNKLFLAFCLTLITGVFAFAQSDYKKAEFYIGYSNNQVDTGANSGNSVRNFFDDRLTFHGFEVAGVYNVHRYFGFKGDFSGAYRNKNFNSTVTSGGVTTNVSFQTNNSLYNVVGGVQFKDNSSDSVVKPFAHIMVGVGHARFKVSNVTCTNAAFTNCSSVVGTDSDTGLAGVFGGGLDLKISNNVDIRAFQIDYNPIRLGGSINHNFRFGAGINFR